MVAILTWPYESFEILGLVTTWAPLRTAASYTASTESTSKATSASSSAWDTVSAGRGNHLLHHLHVALDARESLSAVLVRLQNTLNSATRLARVKSTRRLRLRSGPRAMLPSWNRSQALDTRLFRTPCAIHKMLQPVWRCRHTNGRGHKLCTVTSCLKAALVAETGRL